MEDSKVNLEDSHECDLITNTCEQTLSNDTMLESNNILSKDADTANAFLNAQELNIQKTEEKKALCVSMENMIAQLEIQNDTDKEQTSQEIMSQNNVQKAGEKQPNTASQEDLVTAQQENQCLIDKDCKDEIVSQNNVDNNQQINCGDVACSNLSDLHKADEDTKELNLTKHCDVNSNDIKLTVAHMTKENILKTSENDKASAEAKDKDIYTKKAIATSKTNVKNESSTTLPKSNDKPPTSINPRKSISSLPKIQSPVDKYGKIDRINNKHIFTRKNTYTKEIKQYSALTKEIENKTKDVTAKSNLSRASVEKELNKTANINTNDRKAHSLSNNVNSNRALQTQQRIPPKQFSSKLKGQEFRRSTPALNRLDKGKILEKPEKSTHVPINSDLVLSESEGKNEKASDEKNSVNDQKVYRITNIRSTTFVAQNKNSAFLKSASPKNTSRNVEHISMTCEKNQLRKNNNTILDGGGTDSVENKNVIKEKSDDVLDTLTNANATIDEVHSISLETNVKQNEANIQSANINVSNIDTSTNNKHTVVPLKIDSCPIEDMNKNLNVDCTKQKAVILEKCSEQEKVDCISKVDINQQLTDNKNKELNPPKHSFNPLHFDQNSAESQTNSINRHVLKSGIVQQTSADQLRSNQSVIWNNDLSDSIQKTATIAAKQTSTETMHLQQAVVPAEEQPKKMIREADCGKFYDQFYEQSTVSNATRFPQTPYVYETPQFECNMQVAPSNTTTTMDGNRENSSTSHRYMSNMQQRPFTSRSDFPGHSVPAGQISRWNSSVQDIFHAEQFANTTQPATMQVYNTGAFGSDDFNGTHVNCLSPHSIIYAPPSQCMWNSQLQYPIPMFHNAPCTNYTMFPNVANPNNFNDVAVGPMSMYTHDQHKYINYAPMGNNPANVGPMQVHSNPHYVKGMHGCDMSNNCIVETKGVGDDTPMRSNRYYKKYNQNNYRAVYDVPQYVTSISHPSNMRSQQPFVSTDVNQSNAYCPPPNQKYHKQNMINYMQVSKYPKDQKTPDFVCEDNNLEDIPPIISPKEYLNKGNISDKTDHQITRGPNQDFRTRSNMGYHRSQTWQRYNGGFRRNPAYQDFSKEYTGPVNVGRGASRASQHRKF